MGVLDDLSPTQRTALSSTKSAPRLAAGSDVRDTPTRKANTTASVSSSPSKVRADQRDTSTPTRTNTAAPDPFASSKSRNRSGSPDDRDSGRGRSTSDPVDPDTKLSYGMMLDFLETPERRQPSTSSPIDSPGSSQTWDAFAKDIRNGSMGVPRAAGYGFDYNPDAGPIAFDPMAQDTAAMNESLKAPPSEDWMQMLVDNAHRNEAARVANPPFPGAIDMNADWYQDYRRKFAERTGTPLGDLTTRNVSTVPIDPRTGQPISTGIDSAAPRESTGWEDPWAHLNTDYRLPAEPLPTDVGPAPYSPDRWQANERLLSGEYVPSQEPSPAEAYVPLPRVDPRGYAPVAAINSNYGDPGLVTGTPSGPAAEPSVWDGVVDNTGKLLGHTALGGIVSTLFPDLWAGAGDLMKGLGLDGARGTATADNDFTHWDPNEGAWVGGGAGSGGRNRRNQGEPPPPPPPPPDFPDLNHNGIDDRIEGYEGPDTNVLFDLPPTRSARFPDMPPYNPGRSDEWSYFANNHLADGGVVGYAEGGALDGSDPRVKLIGATEDVLEKIAGGSKPDEADAVLLKKFVAQFGDAALKSLHDNVQGGMTMRGGRLIKGPGGPKDDAVPAVIVDKGSVVSPAKLSNGEFVFPVEAVEGIGEGDATLGAERLQQLAERLSAGKGAK